MFQYIIGEIQHIGENYIVLENNGIGYKIQTSVTTCEALNLYDSQKIYTDFVVREDGVFLYGFLTHQELSMYLLLTGISSIGPKNGLSIMSTLSVDAIKTAVLTNDIAMLSKAPGIGKKTASRIVLELVDKIKQDNFVPVIAPDTPLTDDRETAVEALINLGYYRSDVVSALSHVDGSASLEMLIKEGLKRLSK